MTLLKRILREKRAFIVPLALGIVLNIAAFVLVVYPLGVRSAGAANRAGAAADARMAAERENAAARALLAGKARADQELSTFYDKVLPSDLPAARRLTYATLPALARRTNVQFLDRRFEDEQAPKDAKFGRLKILTRFSGEYASLRRFIYELESAPDFVIIDDVTLAQPDAAKPLALSLALSTYYRLGTHGS
jgi:hypothetical protein